MQTPKFLRNLLQSNNYWNKDSIEFAKANEYLKKLYPGQLTADLSGRYVEPPYDMTLEQFESAQRKLDKELEEAIHEAEDSAGDADGTAEPIDYDQYVDIEETIDVRVLMPNGTIEYMQLVVYTLNLPEKDPEPELVTSNCIWIWHAENDQHICDDCASHNGEVFEDKNDIPEIPVHPNCRCWVEEVELDDNGKPISSKVYKSQKPENQTDTKEPKNMKMSDDGIRILKKQEGSVTKDSKHIIYDDKTGKPLNTNEPLPRGATIGYGHLIKPGEDFRNGISETKATELLRADIATAERAVRDNINVPLTQNQFDALTSLAYNIGTKNFTDSTVVKYVNNPDLKNTTYPTLESAWKTWNKSGGHVMAGLSNRRNQEWNMFNN